MLGEERSGLWGAVAGAASAATAWGSHKATRCHRRRQEARHVAQGARDRQFPATEHIANSRLPAPDT